MNKKILVDCRWSGPTGIGRFFHEMYSRRPDGVDYIELHGGGLGSSMTPIRLAYNLARDSFDAFWSPGFFPPLFFGGSSFITIHDLIHMRQYGFSRRVYYSCVIGPLSRRCKKVFTVSNHSKDDIVSGLGVDPETIVVVPNAPSIEFSPSRFDSNHVSEFGKYIFYAGNRRGYKNVTRLVRSFFRAKIPGDVSLVLSGAPDAELVRIAESFGQINRLIFAGFIPDELMPVWYASAVSVAFVSYDEGFGLPVVEGMASGVPVLASNCSAIPEVAGDGALLVDPFSEDAISRGIELIVNDFELRSNLIVKGFGCSNGYSWDKSAKILWDNIVDSI